MAQTVTITFLTHSGFIVETAQHALLFDYYRDPARAVAQINTAKKLYVFASHAHPDHFNPAIAGWQRQAAAYILSDDIRDAGGLPGVPPEQVRYAAPYDHVALDELAIDVYGSTDAGASFAIAVDGWRIFHAGDLNWWHWREDTAENNAVAKEAFFQELDRLRGQRFDVAFFPVDNRLEDYRDLGVREFVRAVHVDHLVAMHACGPAWQPPADFAGSRDVWCPAQAGESRRISK